MSTVASITHQEESDDGYPQLEAVIRKRVGSSPANLFRTDATDLFSEYLGGINPNRQQHYNCHACRRFVERYGDLVTIDQDGRQQTLLWNTEDVPLFFLGSFNRLAYRVNRARIQTVFINGDTSWGIHSNFNKEQTVEWTHLFGKPQVVYADRLKTADQLMAEKREDHGMLCRALSEYPVAVVEQAVRVLQADALDRSEKTLGVAAWFLKLHQVISQIKGDRRRNNLIWLAVASAPPGWCHIKTTMINTLLDDIKSGVSFDQINRRWSTKMHPLQYQRPTAPPSTGAIVRAEKIVAEMQSAGALDRRFARFEEVETHCFWKQTPIVEQQKPAGGVFSHLKRTPPNLTVQLPTTTMTWEKFQRTILPGAMEIEFQSDLAHRMPFYGMVTAVNPDAPRILQWDNHFSWFFYHGGSSPSDWGLSGLTSVKVKGICFKPCHWQDPAKFSHQSQAVFFILEGAVDQRRLKDVKQGGGFFPETLRSEYHEIRSVMEAYAQKATIAGTQDGSANGVAFQNGDPMPLTFRVRCSTGWATYKLDRWD